MAFIHSEKKKLFGIYHGIKLAWEIVFCSILCDSQIPKTLQLKGYFRNSFFFLTEDVKETNGKFKKDVKCHIF